MNQRWVMAVTVGSGGEFGLAATNSGIDVSMRVDLPVAGTVEE